MNIDVSSSTSRPLVDPRLRFLKPSRRGYTFPDGKPTPSLEVLSSEIVPPAHGTSFGRCIAVGGHVYTHFISDFEGGRGRGKTHSEEPFLLSEDGNRKTNFAGCVNEQFETTNVIGTLHDLDPWVKISTHRYKVDGSPNDNSLPQPEIMFNHQLVLDANHHRVRIHIPFSALHRLHDLHLLHLCLRIHAPLDLGALRLLDYPSQIPMLRSQSQSRGQNVSGSFLRGYLPEYERIQRSRVVQWENRVV